jgi:hypothetical protein
VKRPALVAVDAAPEAFASLFEAARERGVRVGWLDLDAAAASPVPAALEGAAAAGALRAVAVADGRAVTVKPMRGAPVLRDLLREHFLGCALVLARGATGRPRLTPSAAGYRLETDGRRGVELDAGAALAELVRPRHRP